MDKTEKLILYEIRMKYWNGEVYYLYAIRIFHRAWLVDFPSSIFEKSESGAPVTCFAPFPCPCNSCSVSYVHAVKFTSLSEYFQCTVENTKPTKRQLFVRFPGNNCVADTVTVNGVYIP